MPVLIMPTILIATRNLWKAQLFIPVFERYGFNFLTLADIHSAESPFTETGKNAIENALAKARYYHSPAYPFVFADDAGLEIDALGGEPGVQARRWGGRFPDDVDDQTWLDYLLERMRNVPLGRRSARFVAGWAFITPEGSTYTRQVYAPFEIATRPIRAISPGSPITAVRIGPANDLIRRQAEVWAEWQRWGVLDEIVVT
jgi:XTP/dITP diphosphohydrolase